LDWGYIVGLDRGYIVGLDRGYIVGLDRRYIMGLDRGYIVGLDKGYIPDKGSNLVLNDEHKENKRGEPSVLHSVAGHVEETEVAFVQAHAAALHPLAPGDFGRLATLHHWHLILTRPDWQSWLPIVGIAFGLSAAVASAAAKADLAAFF
jgi:hypothetical protein